MNINAINWNQMEWTPVREGVDRKAVSGQGATVALHRLMPGHEPKPHAHIHEQIAYIVDGECDFHVGDDVFRLGPGGVVVIPPNVQHWAEVIGDKPVMNLDVFTPRRPEYA
jgi:quercetin dioxygenase-like cupin family protein